MPWIEQRTRHRRELDGILPREDGSGCCTSIEHGKKCRPTGCSRKRQNRRDRYTRRTDTPTRGLLAFGKEPIGIGRIVYGKRRKSKHRTPKRKGTQYHRERNTVLYPLRHQHHHCDIGRYSCLYMDIVEILEQGVSVDTPCCYLVITITPAPQQPFLPLSYESQTESSGLLPSAACGFLPFRKGCVPTRSTQRKPCGRSSAWRCAKSCHR